MKKQSLTGLIVIAFILLLQGQISTFAAEQNAVYVVRMNDKAMIEKSGAASASSFRRKTSLYTAKWDKHIQNQEEGKTLTFPVSEDLDFRQYQSIHFWVYSEKKTDASIAVYLENTEDSRPWRYQYSHFKVDFKGWKEVSIDLSDMNPIRFGSMQSINRIGFSAYGWDCTPHAETVLYIDDIYLLPIEKEERVPETAADFLVWKEQWRAYLCGSGEAADSREEKERIAAIDRQCGELMGSMATGQDAPSLWGSSVPSSTATLSTYYSNLYTMAKAYASPISTYYKDRLLGERLRFGLSWMHHHMYGEAEWMETGWYTAVSSNNWWDWTIGAPTALVNTLFLTDDLLPQSEMQQYLKDIARFVPQVGMTDSNKACITYVVLASAVLSEDTVRFANGYDAAKRLFYNTDQEVRYSTGMQEGFYRDGSYLFHGKHPMNGTYGLEHYKALAALAAVCEKSGCGFSKAQLAKATEWFRSAFLPFCYQGGIMSSVRGRYPGMEQEAGTDLAGALADFSVALPETDDGGIRAYLASEMQNGTVLTERLNGSQTETLCRLSSLDLAKAWSVPQGVKIYPHMDRAVWHGAGFSVGLSMSSSRIYNYECISGCNQNGWYTGDGMLLLYQDGFSRYDTDYWRDANPYRRPGTTVDEQKRELISISNADAYLSSKDFVGGAATKSGDAGVCAMELESFHSDGDGDRLAIHENDLTAKKAWFMFRNELVALGSGISGTQDSMTETVVDNQKIGSSGKLSVNGKTVFPGADAAMSAVSCVSVGDQYGYYFPQAETLRVRRSGAYAEIWQEHGIAPKDASYAYVLLPNRNRQAVQAYSENPRIRILVNEKNVQAVKNEERNQCGMVFYNAATVEDVTAQNPCIVIKTEERDTYQLTIAAPDHKTRSVTLCLNRTDLTLSTADAGITVWEEGQCTKVKMDTASCDGESYHVTFLKPQGSRLRVIENTDGVFWIAYDNSGCAETELTLQLAWYDRDGVLRDYQTETVTVSADGKQSKRLQYEKRRDMTFRCYVLKDARQLVPAEAAESAK